MRTLVTLLTVIVMAAIATPSFGHHKAGHATVEADADMITGKSGSPMGSGQGGSHGIGGSVQQVVNNPAVYRVGLGETADAEGGTTPCWQVVTGGSATLAEAREVLSDFDGNGRAFDACPGGGRGPTLAERVQAQFERWRASPVAAEIDPGYAVTGLRAYLEITDPTPTTITLVGQGVSLTTEYRVRWGDGASTTTTSPGVPYPGGEGEVSHVYRDAEQLVVEVDLVVRGSWNGRDLGALAPVTTTLPLDVREVQAVRRR